MRAVHTTLALALSENNPFFLITGLPVHTLVVHFAVSMLPLSAIALVAIVLVPRWRGAFVWAAIIGLIIGTGAAFISMLSGQALANVVGVPSKHSKWGDVLPWLGLALLVVALVWWYLWRKSVKPDPLPRISMGKGGLMVTGIIAIVLSAVVFALTVLVGHTGAEAVWVTRSLDSEAVEDSTRPVVTPSGSAAATGGLDLTIVAGHATAGDCWSVVSGIVYDLTTWIPQHPGGSGVIENMCGRDGTKSYNGQHQGDAAADAVLSSFLIGSLGGPLPGASAPASSAASASAAASAAPASSAAASGAAASGAITAADVATHGTASDCWSSVDGNVYDLTSWIDVHPGGPDVIVAMCGSDGTAMFNSVHQGQGGPQQALDGMLVGPLG